MALSILYPPKDFLSCVIREWDYYFFNLPTNVNTGKSKRLYARDKADLLDKITNEQRFIRSQISKDDTIYRLFDVYNNYVYEDTKKNKLKFKKYYDLLNDIDDCLKKPVSKLSVEDLISIQENIFSKFKFDSVEYIYSRELEIIEFVKWLGFDNNLDTLELIDKDNTFINKSKPKYLTKENIKDIIEETKRKQRGGTEYNYSLTGFIIEISAHTGLYAYDILKYTFDKVDFDNNTINGIDIPTDVTKRLLELKEGKKANDLIFPNILDTTITATFNIILSNCVLSSLFTLKDLQVYKMIEMQNQGVEMAVIKEKLNIASYSKLVDLAIKGKDINEVVELDDLTRQMDKEQYDRVLQYAKRILNGEI